MIDLPPDRIAEYRAFLDMLADAAREEIIPRFRVDIEVDDKMGKGRGFDPVTEADREAERGMRALIAQRYPDHGVIGEEFGISESESGFSFILDPVDGTRAFIAGLPLWGTLIGLAYHGEPVIGVLDQGYLDERFVGFPGGAVLKSRGVERGLRARSRADLRDAVLATTDPTLFNPAELGGFTMVRDTVRLTRYGCDCYAYGMIAAGGVDMVIESGLRVWDVAALIPIVRGAGGAFCNWRGGSAALGGQVIAASDQRLIDQALVALKRCADHESQSS